MADETHEIPVACSNCFNDCGLRLDAEAIGRVADDTCPNCGSKSGKKLAKGTLDELAYRFFTWGSLRRFDYGAAPEIVFNQHQRTSVELTSDLKKDTQLFERTLGIGFFYYGPRAWMYGEITPLKALRDPQTRAEIVDRMLREYPSVSITSNDRPFYRVRKAPTPPSDPTQYDSPPDGLVGNGRLDSVGRPVLYASSDLEICVHECRVTIEDELYVATLAPTDSLRPINFAVLLREDQGVTEFDSLDLTVHMMFLAGNHAFEVTRAISAAAQAAGFDGIIYPSYFSLVRHGAMPFQAAVYGISNRRIPEFQSHEAEMAVQNLAIFGQPIRDGKVSVKCINRLMLTRASYHFLFGPVSRP